MGHLIHRTLTCLPYAASQIVGAARTNLQRYRSSVIRALLGIRPIEWVAGELRGAYAPWLTWLRLGAFYF